MIINGGEGAESFLNDCPSRRLALIMGLFCEKKSGESNMKDNWADYEECLEQHRRRIMWRWVAIFLLLIIGVIGLSLWAKADTARIDYPDGTKECTFQALTVSPSSATLTVSGCYLGETVDQPPPPPIVSGDPGSGVWVTPTGVTVFDLSSSSNRTFVPGCIRGESWNSTDCEYNGSMKAGQIYAARVKVPRNGQTNLKFDRAETGEADGGSGVHGALSSIPGDTQTGSTSCVFGAIDPYITVSTSVSDADFCSFLPPELRSGCRPADPLCTVSADTVYYLNFTPTLPSCGNGAECRVQIIEN